MRSAGQASAEAAPHGRPATTYTYNILYNNGMIVTSYSEARAKLAALMDKATEDAEEIRITRRGKPDVVLIAADELEGLRETAYLLRSPANATRLLVALADVEAGRNLTPMTREELKRDVGLAD